jgi:hypothetical protein
MNRVPPFTLKGHPKPPATWVSAYLSRYLGEVERGFGIRLARTARGNLTHSLGQGEFGATLATEDGRVIKFTTDDAEPIFGMEIQSLQRGSDPVLRHAANEGVVRIDKILRLPGLVRHKGSTVPVYGVLRENVSPLSSDNHASEDVEAALNAHFDGWATYFDLQQRKIRRTTKTNLLSFMNVLDGWEAISNSDLKELEPFSRVQEWLWNRGIPHMDTHYKNFGWRLTGNRSLVLFDLGGSVPLTRTDPIRPLDRDDFLSYYPWETKLSTVPAVSAGT